MFHHFPTSSATRRLPGALHRARVRRPRPRHTGPTQAELEHQGSTRFASFMRAVTQSGYVATDDDPSNAAARPTTYVKRSLPPLEFEYSKAAIDDGGAERRRREPREPARRASTARTYQWVDLDGEGSPGILTEQGGAWFYKRNLGPQRRRRRATRRHRTCRRARAARGARHAGGARPGRELLDLAGDGQLDVVALDGPAPGFFERTPDGGWEPFRPFASAAERRAGTTRTCASSTSTGDGHADILITEDDVLHLAPSLARGGLRAGRRRPPAARRGDAARASCSPTARSRSTSPTCRGDGLTDLVRIRNGEVCYWPNLGYGRFGAKVTMDNAPWFDTPGPVRPAAHSPGRHRRLGHHRHHLPAPRRRAPVLQPDRATAGATRASLHARSRTSTTSRRSRRRRPARQRHGLPRLVLAAAGRRATARCATST